MGVIKENIMSIKVKKEFYERNFKKIPEEYLKKEMISLISEEIYKNFDKLPLEYKEEKEVNKILTEKRTLELTLISIEELKRLKQIERKMERYNLGDY